MVNITKNNTFKYSYDTMYKLFCLTLFTAILFNIINMAKHNEAHILRIPLLVATIMLSIIGIAIMLYYQKKINY